MASNTIARASLTLTADSSELTKGLADTDKKVKDWGQNQEKVKGKQPGQPAADKPQEGKSGGDKGGGKGAAGWIGRIQAVATVATASVAALTAAAGASVAIFSGLSEGIAKTAKQARELGVGVEGFSALQHVAKVSGVGVDDLAAGVGALQENLMKSGPAAERLFGPLGLSVDALRKMPEDEQFATVVDALNKIQDPAQKNALTLKVLGDNAYKLGPIMAKGGDGIRLIAAAARASGVALDGLGVEQVLKAREAIAAMSAKFEGLMNTVVIAAAPWITWGIEATQALTGGAWSALQSFGTGINQYITGPVLAMSAPVVDVLSNIGTTLVGVGATMSSSWGEMWASMTTTVATEVEQWTATITSWANSVAEQAMPIVTSALEMMQPYTDMIGQWFGAAYEAVSTAVSNMGESISGGLTAALQLFGVDAKAVFAQVQAVVESLIGYIKSAAGYVSGLMEYLGKRTAAGDAVRDAAEGLSKGAEDTGRSAGEKIAKGLGDGLKKGVEAPLNSVNSKVLKGVNDLEAEMRKGIATVGMTGPMARIHELGEQGADPKQIESLKKLAEQQRVVEAGWSQVQEFTPKEVFDRQLEGLEKLREAGRITEDQYKLGVTKSNKELIAAAGGSEIKTVGGAAQGSSAAVSAIIKSDLQSRVANDPVAEARRAANELKRIQEKQLATSEKILQAIEDGNDEEEVDF